MHVKTVARAGAWFTGVCAALAACVVLLSTSLFSNSEADQIPEGAAEQALWWAPIAVMIPLVCLALRLAARDRLVASLACSVAAAGVAAGWYAIAGYLRT